MAFARKICLVAALSALSGCASIITGTTQRINVSSDPEGANCRVSRGGMTLGVVPSTPGSIVVHRSSIGLEITCSKPGYTLAQTTQPTNIEGWIFGNVLIGGLIGVVVDFSTGAAYTYDGDAALALEARPGPGAPFAGYTPDRPGYQPTSVAYAHAATADYDPLVVPPSTPKGDITYRWGSSAQN
jgi:hypothetical protein